MYMTRRIKNQTKLFDCPDIFADNQKIIFSVMYLTSANSINFFYINISEEKS